MPTRPTMKLLVVTMLYEPDCVGIAAIASDMCRELSQRGHQVTVYTTYPYYPEWRHKSASYPWRVTQENIAGVQVVRHRIFVPANPSRLVPRLLHELSFPLSLLRSLFHRGRFDAVMVFCPLLGSVVFGGLRKWIAGEPLWVNIQDIPVEAASASGIIRSSLFARWALKAQAFLLNRADAWSTISRDMAQRLETIRRGDCPIHLCPNWLTGSLQDQIGKLPAKVGRIPQSPPRLLYCGTIGKKQGLLELCQALRRSETDFRFRIQGDGGEAAGVRRWVETQGDLRFTFGPLLSEPEFVQAIHDADWFVIPQRSSAGNAFFPSKIMPSILIGTPILAISEPSGPLYEEVFEHQIGCIVPWTSLPNLFPAIEVYSAAAPLRYTQLQTNCLRRAQAYDRSAAMNRMEDLLWRHAKRGESLEETPVMASGAPGRWPLT